MKVPATFVKNFLYSKFGKIFIIAILVFILFVAVSTQFSVENKCKRKVEGLVKLLPSELVTNKIALESVKRQEIAKCINEGN